MLITQLWPKQVGTPRLSCVSQSADLCLQNLSLSDWLQSKGREKTNQKLSADILLSFLRSAYRILRKSSASFENKV